MTSCNYIPPNVRGLNGAMGIPCGRAVTHVVVIEDWMPTTFYCCPRHALALHCRYKPRITVSRRITE